MPELPPENLEITDVLVDPIAVRDALRFIYQMRGLQVILNTGTRTLTTSETAQNAVLDLREDPAEPEIVP